jgi:hypothetical protein
MLLVISAPVQQRATYVPVGCQVWRECALTAQVDGPVQYLAKPGRVPFCGRVHASDLPFKPTVLAPENYCGSGTCGRFDVAQRDNTIVTCTRRFV